MALAKATPAITPIKPPPSAIVADSIRYCSITSPRPSSGSKLQRAEALERYAHEASSQIRHGKAATRAERGKLILTRLDYLLVAQHFKSLPLTEWTEVLGSEPSLALCSTGSPITPTRWR